MNEPLRHEGSCCKFCQADIEWVIQLPEGVCCCIDYLKPALGKGAFKRKGSFSK